MIVINGKISPFQQSNNWEISQFLKSSKVNPITHKTPYKYKNPSTLPSILSNLQIIKTNTQPPISFHKWSNSMEASQLMIKKKKQLSWLNYSSTPQIPLTLSWLPFPLKHLLLQPFIAFLNRLVMEVIAANYYSQLKIIIIIIILAIP